MVPSERAMMTDSGSEGKEMLERRGNGLGSEIEIGRKPMGRIPVVTLNECHKTRCDVCCFDGERVSHSTFYHRGHSTTRTKQQWSLLSPLSWPMV